jgi:signal transduction histidine kinase
MAWTSRRSTLIVLLLILAVAATTVLAYQAQQAARSHRATAESVLRDYAEFAGWEFSRLARRALYDTLNVELDRLRCIFDYVGVEPAAGEASPAADCCGTMRWEPRTAFRLPTPGAGLEQAGVPLRAVTAARLKSVYDRALLDRDTHDCPMFAVEQRDGRATLLVWRVLWDRRGEPAGMIGFETGPDRLTALFERVLDDSALLPPSLAGGEDVNGLLSVRVSDPQGRELFASSAEWSIYASEQSLEAALGGLSLAVALRPDAAAGLIIGGLPRDRLPLLVGLLAVTVGLVVVALVQFRREQELVRLRTDFVSGVSHELRTPLAQIRLFTETLLLGRVRSPEDERRSLEVIRRESRRLAQLVENVLYFSRADHRTMALSPRWCALGPRVGEVVQAFEPLARARGAQFAMYLEAGLEAEVDGGAIRQVVLNLIDNAVKYGPPGQTIVVGVARDGDGARLWVDDQGPGVAAAERERIWEPFCRLSRPEVAHAGGSGIGLAIVRELVALHGGRVAVEPAPAGGARFVVVLPSARVGIAGRAAVGPRVAAPAGRSRIPA